MVVVGLLDDPVLNLTHMKNTVTFRFTTSVRFDIILFDMSFSQHYTLIYFSGLRYDDGGIRSIKATSWEEYRIF